VKDRTYTWVIIPFFLINQISFLPIITKREPLQVYEFEVGTEENEIIIENDPKKSSDYSAQKERFVSIEQRLTMLVEQPQLPSTKEQIKLGIILESMSGGILYGRKYASKLYTR
jgi:hypothetical protein